MRFLVLSERSCTIDDQCSARLSPLERPMILGAQEQLIPGVTWADKLATLDSLGYEGLEVWGASILDDDQELVAATADSPVGVAAIAAGYRGGLLDPSRSERALAQDDLRRLLETSERLGAVGVVVVPDMGEPQLPDLFPLRSREEIEQELLLATLSELADWLSGMTSRILLEPLNRYETHFLTRAADAVAIAKALDSPNVSVLVDLFHANIEEVDIVRTLRETGPHLGYVHLADSNRRWPGTGHIDFPAVYRALREIGYEGFSSIEIFKTTGDLREELSRVRALWA